MSCSREIFDKIIQLILNDAKSKRKDAGYGYGGRMDDGGASNLEDQVKYFQYGLICKLPPEWESYKKQLDPEYIEFLRLKRKFTS
jgi:hypothetical protein